MTRESKIERELVDELARIGVVAYKFVSPGRVGVPDRLCVGLYPNIFFVEVKQPGESLKPWQKRRRAELEAMGYKVWKCESASDIVAIVVHYEKQIRIARLSKTRG